MRRPDSLEFVDGAALAFKRVPYYPGEPTPHQRAFLGLTCREAFYGGAAGGGKSEALFMAALQYIDVPRYSALIIRKTYADLSKPGALMDRAAMYLSGSDAVKREGGKRWDFPSGATLTFGYVANPTDVYQYQSAEYQFIGWDEGTQFGEWEYRYMFSRLRKPEGLTGTDPLAGVPLRMRMASNPGGYGHEWVKRRMLVEGAAKGRVYVPARLEHNPHVDRESYVQGLLELPEVERRQLLEGDWEARVPGEYWDRAWCELVDGVPSDGMRWVRYWDLAGTVPIPGRDPDWTVGTLLGLHLPTMYWYVADVVRFRANPGETRRRVREVAMRDGISVPVRIEQDPGQAGKDQIESYIAMLLEFDARGIRPSGNKETRFKPVSAHATPATPGTTGKMRVKRAAWNGPWFDELEGFPTSAHDDQADSLSGGYNYLAGQVSSGVQQHAYRPQRGEPVIRRGDLTLRGEQYIDRG